MLQTRLKTQQLADMLGISVSSLKRWVDAGELRAARTVGRHRLIALDEALRFARRRNLVTADLERLAQGESGVQPGPSKTPIPDLEQALKGGRAHDARRIIQDAHAVLGGAAQLGDDLIAPVMATIGWGWALGEWDIFEEHQASQIVSACLSELILSGVRDSKVEHQVALGSSPSGDQSTLALLLAELTLREAGWDVKNLGSDLPLTALTRAIRAYRPGLVFMTVGHLVDPIAFLGEFATLSEACERVGAELIVGGRGLPIELRSRLKGARFGDRLVALSEFGQDVLARSGSSREVGARSSTTRLEPGIRATRTRDPEHPDNR